MSIDLNELKAQQLEYLDSVRSIEDRATQEERDVTEEEVGQIDDFLAKAKVIADRTNRLDRLSQMEAELAKSAGRKTENSGGTRITGGIPASTRDTGKWGFKSFGEYAQSVANSAQRGRSVDPRLIANAATTYTGEGSGADGGFAVPPDFRSAIVIKVMGEGSLLGRTDQQVTSSNSMTFPVDETTPWDTTTGVQVYWSKEGAVRDPSKARLEERTYRLDELTAFCPITNEIMEDAGTLERYLTAKIPVKMDHKINLSLLQGTGVGQPLGAFNSASKVVVAAESGQAADTLVVANLFNLWSRMYGECRQNAVWMINQDVEPQLFGLQFTGAAGATPVYLPAGSVAGTPYATIFGRPVLTSQACETLGNQGDIVLVDWSQYMTITKTSGPRNEISPHFYFDQNITAFRTTFRLTGAPWWGTYITPRSGTNYLSWCVVLAERS